MVCTVLRKGSCDALQLDKQLKDEQRKSMDASKQNHELRKLLDKYRRVGKFVCSLLVNSLLNMRWTNVQ